jgi:ribonucleoside-diphosphate reductase alpha chain
LAVAPNTSSAFIAGAKSQGIEPWVANIFNQKLAKVGSVERINPVLLDILKTRGYYNDDIVDSISFNKGSVQHLDSKILSDHEKEVFKTAYEINQKSIIDLAEQRQQWICQGQSLNLFFDANEDEGWIHEVHKYAFEQTRLKSLYYVRTQPGISADKDDTCKACGGDFIEVINITISKVSNGWVITTYFEDDTEIVEVYDIDGKDDGNKQSIKCIIKSMGLENEVKIM